MKFEIKKFAFLYGDYAYFRWFKGRTKKDLKNIIIWKGLHRGKGKLNVEKIWDEEKKEININDSFPSVTKAFLHHLKSPLNYPILDKYVFQAMKRLTGNKYKTNKNISNNWNKDYESSYKQFFNDIYTKYEEEIDSMNLPDLDRIDKEIIKRRVLDRALWEFGKQISEAKECRLTNFPLQH